MSEAVKVERAGAVAILRLNDPSAMNALSPPVKAGLQANVPPLLADAAVRAIVLTGTGKAFCAGGDIRAMTNPEGRKAPAVRTRMQAAHAWARALLDCDKPVIAAVNGAAVGWGMELALMADFRIVSERARFGELFVRRGLVSDPVGLGRLAQLVGREKATELLMTGDVIDADEARRIGLVGRVVPHEELLNEAGALARRIAANPPLAVRAIKQGLRRALDPDWASLGRWVSETLDALFQTEDHREGVRAFLEKREPRFTGR